MSRSNPTISLSRRDRVYRLLDDLITLKEKQMAAEYVWMNDSWDGESVGADEDRYNRLRNRYFLAEERTERMIHKMLKIIDCDI